MMKRDTFIGKSFFWALAITILLLSCEPPVEEVVKVIAPTYKPGNIRQVFSHVDSIRLTWDNVSSRKEFIVKRSDTLEGSYIEVGRVNSNYYTDYKLTTATVYYYKISYINSDGVESAESDSFVAITAIPAVAGFEIPTFDADKLEVSIKWLQNVEATGYELFREQNLDGNFTLITPTPLASGVTSYLDNTIVPNISYRYKIRAYKELASGLKSYSEDSSIKNVTVNRAIPQGIVVKSVGEGVVELNWRPVNAPTLGLKGYYVYRAEDFKDIDSSYSVVGNIPLSPNPSFIDKNLSPGKKYFYKIASYDIRNREYISEYIQIFTIPPPVEGVNIDSVFIKDNQFEIKWNQMPITANTISGYKIMCKTAPFLSSKPAEQKIEPIIDYYADGKATNYIMDKAVIKADTDYYVYVSPYVLTNKDQNTTPGDEDGDVLYSRLEQDGERIKGDKLIRTKMVARVPVVGDRRTTSLDILWDFEDWGDKQYEYHIYRSNDIKSSFDEGTKQAVIYIDYDVPGNPLLVIPAGLTTPDQHKGDKIFEGGKYKIKYTNNKLELGKTYYYKLKVKRKAKPTATPPVVENESVFPIDPIATNTQILQVTGLAQDTTATDYTSITLTWNKDAGVPHYIVYRQKMSGDPVETLDAPVDAEKISAEGTFTFKDSTVEYGVAYQYYVAASTTPAGGGGTPGPVSSTIGDITTELLECNSKLTAVTSATAGETEIDLSWDSVAGVDYYTIIMESASTAKDNVKVAGDPKIVGTTVTATGLSPGTKYTFTLYAHLNPDTSGIVSVPIGDNIAIGYTCPGIPTLTSVMRKDADLDTYLLSWTKSTAGTGTTVKYKLYRWMSDKSTGYTNPDNYSPAGTNIDTNIKVPDVDANLTPFKEYYYMVKAYIPLAGPGGTDLESTGYSTPVKGNLETGLGTPEGFGGTVSGTEVKTMNLSWDAISPPDVFTVTYRIEKLSGGVYVPLTTTTGLSSQDGTVAGSTATYRIRAEADGKVGEWKVKTINF